MGRGRRRRLLVWALLALGAWALLRIARVPAAAPAPADETPPAAPVAPAPVPAPRVSATPVPTARVGPSRVAAPRRRTARPVGHRGSSGARPAVIATVALVMLAGGVAAAVGVRGDGLSGGEDASRPIWSLGLGERAEVPAAALWAPVLRATRALSRPAEGAVVVGDLPARTPEGTRNIVLMADPGAARAGGRWVRVRLAGGTQADVGWVRRTALGRLTSVDGHLFVDLGARRLTLVRRGRVVLQAPAGIGTAGAPSPVGDFYVRNRLIRFAGARYGPVAFGLSAEAPALTDWPVAGAVGIHGTNRPQLVPGPVSRGSIWLRNPDVRRLARLLPIGTPVTIG